MFKIFNRNRDFKDEFFYLENTALKLYKKSKYKRSFEYYNKLLKASEDFKNNSAEKHFKWYDEILSPCLKKYCDNYDEFFKHLFLVDMETYDAWFDKAILYNDNFKRDEAIDYCYKLLKIKPHDLSLLEYLGNMLYFSHRYDDALDIYDIALDIDKNNKKIIHDKWYVYYDSDRLNDALTFLKNLENIDDMSSEDYNSTGYKFEDNREYETALWCYKKGFETEEYSDTIFDTESVDGIKRVLIKSSIDDYSLLGDFYLEWISKIEYKFDTQHCPKCGGNFTQVVYGYVVRDKLFDEQRKGNVIHGGCTVFEDSPTHYCKNCDEEFQFKSNGLKINYEPKTRQYHYVEKIIRGITDYITNNQDEGSINIRKLKNEMKRIYGLNDIEFKAIIDKLIDIGYMYKSSEDHISLSEDNFYSLP